MYTILKNFNGLNHTFLDVAQKGPMTYALTYAEISPPHSPSPLYHPPNPDAHNPASWPKSQS